MMRRLLPLAGVLAALACTMPATAQTTSTAPTPMALPAKPDFGPAKDLIGTWSCSLKSSRRPTAAKWTQVNALSPDGYWLVEKSDQAPTSWYPHTIHSTDYVTYDTDQKHWVDLEVDDGGGYDVSTSMGPTGTPGCGTTSACRWALMSRSQTDTTTDLNARLQTFKNSFTTKDGKSGIVNGILHEEGLARS